MITIINTQKNFPKKGYTKINWEDEYDTFWGKRVDVDEIVVPDKEYKKFHKNNFKRTLTTYIVGTMLMTGGFFIGNEFERILMGTLLFPFGISYLMFGSIFNNYMKGNQLEELKSLEEMWGKNDN